MHHGVPLAIVSDRGPQFVSSFWGRVCERLSIQGRLSTAFQPQADGGTERADQEFERCAFTTYAQDNWKDLLPIVAVAINNREAASTGISPFFFTRKAGETFVNRLREATDWTQAAIAAAQALQEEQTNRRRQAAPIYKKDDWVWLNLWNVRTQQPSKKQDMATCLIPSSGRSVTAYGPTRCVHRHTPGVPYRVGPPSGNRPVPIPSRRLLATITVASRWGGGIPR
jgi:hypothetical protein